MNLDMALTRVGGFGLFQIINTIGMSLMRVGGGPLLYLFAYLTMPQKYECKMEPEAPWEACDAYEVICPALEQGSYIEYQIDKTYQYYLINWQQQMDLMCMPMSAVNKPYVLYFFCFGAGGLLTFFVIDKLGRTKAHRIFGTGHFIAQAIIIFIPNMLARTIGYCLLGAMMAKNSLCMIWSFEFLLKDHKGAVNALLNMSG